MSRSDWCPILEKMVNREPMPIFNDEFNSMSEREQDSISYDESRKYIVDLDGYNKKQDEHRKRMGKHMKICTHPDCKQTLRNWQEDKEMKQYV